MGTFDLSIKLGRAAFDVGVPDPKILDMPMELGLELVAVIRPNFSNAKRELFDDVINEVDCVCLSVLPIDFERSNACCIIDCSILKPAHFLTAFSFESQKLNVDLYMMPWHLLLISFGVQFPHSCASRQSVETVALEDAVNSCVRDFDAVIACQIPDDPDWPQVIFATQIQNLFCDIWRRLVGRVLWNRFGILQTGFAMLLMCIPPSIEAGSPNSEISASFAGIANLLGMLKHSGPVTL